MIVYKVINKINGKIYIGSSINKLYIRKNQHMFSAFKINSNYIIHRALRKYGKENFIWIVLEECETQEEIWDLEYHYIKQYKSKINGYNSTDGYDNTTLGYKFTKEQRKKCIRYGKDNSNYGNKWSNEQKKKASLYKKEHFNIEGENNPAKRPEVRKILSKQKMGMKNPRAKIWFLTSPEGIKYKIEGGIKRKIQEFGLKYYNFRFNKKYKGWILEKV